jgi:hypothetical protein
VRNARHGDVAHHVLRRHTQSSGWGSE